MPAQLKAEAVVCNYMKLLISITFTFGTIFQGITQHLVKDYKRIADKSLLDYCDSSVAAKVLCDRFTIVSLDKQHGGRYFYNENKNKRLLFSEISFRYSLFDKDLNDHIDFYISVSKNLQIIRDSSVLKKVPFCIRKSQTCNFISSDSAKQIAITDSIEYANNLSSQFKKNKLDKEYYWIITGHDHPIRSKSNKPSLDVYAEGITTAQERIINAQTGQIITYKLFDYDW